MLNSDFEYICKIQPVAVKYKCEFCWEGEMIADPTEPIMMIATNPPQYEMRTHICSKCKKTMKLPKTYPYIEWLSQAEYNNLEKSGLLKED